MKHKGGESLEKEKDFIQQNKEAIMEEMAGNINALSSLVSQKLTTIMIEHEQPVHPEMVDTFMDISTSVGYMVALFSQLMVLERGFVQGDDTPAIGFTAMLDRNKK